MKLLIRLSLCFVVILGIAFCLLLYRCSQPDYVVRFDKPLTYEEAVKNPDVDFPLPATSSEIYYGMYADWQTYTRIVRFKAPVEDCISHIDSVIKWDERMYHRTSSYLRKKVSRVDHQGAGCLEPAKWFTPETITDGLYEGKDSSHTPQIWVDLDRGIFYFKVTD
ncbi:MAG: hypothetical protein ABI600_05565 [Luteolibacter sp.]